MLEGTVHELREKILSNRSVEKERQLERQRRDKTEEDSEDIVVDDKSEEDNQFEEDLHNFYRALKNMEILGQILRNKYGSLPRERIGQVIEFVADAGLRLIKVVTNRENIQSLEGYFIEVLKNEDIPEDNKREIETFLRKQIRTLVFLIIGSLLKKVVISIRKPELLEVVETMVRRKNTPAYDLLYSFLSLGHLRKTEFARC